MNVSRETQVRLDVFAREFTRWNARSNLSSRTHPGELTERHIEDSLQLIPLAPKEGSWVDVGTGGGFPGAVLAAVFAETGRSITMIESNAKKAAFLRSACLAMKVPANVLNERAEAVVARERPPAVVSARAVAPLRRLFTLLQLWLAEPGTLGLFPKGREVETEIDDAAREWDFDLVRHPSRTAADGTILAVTRLRPKNRRDPRG